MKLSDTSFGIGLRQPHYREVFERRPALGFVEVHSENFFQEGGASLRALERARAVYPVSLHGVGLSLGAADEISARHLGKLQRLVERIEPALVSEHLSWGHFGGEHFNDLLPMPYTEEALAHLVARVGRVQDILGRRLLLENVSSYIAFAGDEMSEWEFIAELSKRADCELLLDVNNVYVSSRNHGFDARRFIDAMPAERVRQIHLAGHEDNGTHVIDTHDHPVCDAVWELYGYTVRRLGPVPTMIERDDHIPPLDELLAELDVARQVATQAAAQAATERAAQAVPA